MTDPAGEIRHLLNRYQEAMSSGDLTTLCDLHWQDHRFVHVEDGGLDSGWGTYEDRLKFRFERGTDDFHLTNVRIEVFHGKFGSAIATWESFVAGSSSRGGGTVSFVLSRMGSSWKIVADHHAPAGPDPGSAR
jgi:ketosteroid isomerase-like protein